MMDFYAECEKRKQGRLQKIGELCYRRQQASRAIEDNERIVREADEEITAHETALKELDQAQRNFNTYLAVKENALTTEQLARAIEEEKDLQSVTAKAAAPAPGSAPEPALAEKKEATDA